MLETFHLPKYRRRLPAAKRKKPSRRLPDFSTSLVR